MKKRWLGVSFVLLVMTTANVQKVSAATIKADSAGVKVGYVSGSSKTMAGAVDKITEERMNKGLVNNSLEALNGQSAGVSIGSQEAMISSVRVRGTTSLTGGNDPLVIIDGIWSDISTMNTIYPADIESFTILKDASETAQYGSRGAAGVIEVATKKGRFGQFHISYDGNMGWESVYKNMEMLSGNEFVTAAKRLGVSVINKGYDTDFVNSITRTGMVQNHHIAFGGGSRTANYRASVGVLDHRMVVQRNNYRNYIAKLDVTQLAFDEHLTVDLGVFGSLQRNNNLPFLQKLFYSAAAFNPTYSLGKNLSGGWDQIPDASQINNPRSLLEMKDDEDKAYFNTHVRLNVDLGRGLAVTAFGSYSYAVSDLSQYFPTIVWSHGQAYRSEDKTEEALGNVSLTYNHDWGKHHLDLLGLGEVQSQTMKGFYTTVSSFSTDAFGYNNLAAGAVRAWGGTGSYFENPHTTSFLARANYIFDNRYTLTANARTDASSKFGKNHRWGFFPSASGAWVVSNEAFMHKVRWISNLKLRTGYGLSGSMGGINSYNSQQLVQPNGVVPVEGATAVTLGIIRNANPDLKWEVKHTFNVGLDVAFWNNRVVLTADYYYSKTTDMLYMYDVSVPPYTYNKLLANLGSMRNSGLEIGLAVTPIKEKDMELNVNLNLAFVKNKLLSLSGNYNGDHLTAPDITAIAGLNGAGFHGGYNNVVYQIVGQSLGVFYLPHCTGLKKNSNGSYSYQIEDLNHDGVINLEDGGGDRYVAGQATPKVTLGSNISFRYKRWDVSLQMNGAFGHKIYNGTSLTYMNMLSLPNYNVMKGAPEKNIQDQTATDYWLENGNYLNFTYLTLGWNVPLGKAKYISSLRLSCSVNNLATITAYSGLTPMVNSSAVNSTLGVDDKSNYPVYRSFMFGVNVTF